MQDSIVHSEMKLVAILVESVRKREQIQIKLLILCLKATMFDLIYEINVFFFKIVLVNV